MPSTRNNWYIEYGPYSVTVVPLSVLDLLLTMHATLSHRPKLKVNRILLMTATGVRYTLEAASSDDRDSWVSELSIASKIISH